MKLALAQQAVECGAVEANVDRAVAAVERAAADGADCVALPELFDVGYFAFDDYADAAGPLGGPTHRRLREAAVANDVAVLAGTVSRTWRRRRPPASPSPIPRDSRTPPSSSTPTTTGGSFTGSTTSSATTPRRPNYWLPARTCRRPTSAATPSA